MQVDIPKEKNPMRFINLIIYFTDNQTRGHSELYKEKIGSYINVNINNGVGIIKMYSSNIHVFSN